jgi:hypothetical protein
MELNTGLLQLMLVCCLHVSTSSTILYLDMQSFEVQSEFLYIFYLIASNQEITEISFSNLLWEKAIDQYLVRWSPVVISASYEVEMGRIVV